MPKQKSGFTKNSLFIPHLVLFSNLSRVTRYCNRVHKSQETTTNPAGRPSSPSSTTKPGRRPSTAHDDPDDDAPPSIYHTLLSLYLKPPTPYKPIGLGPALDLLSKHGSRLPAASTLSLIPDGLPIADLESYFRGRIRAANSAVSESRVVAGLRQTELVASQALLLLGDGAPGGQGGRNRRVVVSDERVCGVCHKRLGGSVVAVLPDNAVVHYGCLSRAAGAVPPGSSGSGSGTAGGGGWLGAQRAEGARAGAWGRTGGLGPEMTPAGRTGGLGAELASGGWG